MHGVSAIEFALILPIMLALLFGVTEFGRAIDHYRRVTLLARAVADLTSQGDGQPTMAAAAMTDICFGQARADALSEKRSSDRHHGARSHRRR